MEKQTVTLDVRSLPGPQKHSTIFRTFEGLNSGETLILVNDHDPKPLYYQFAAEKTGQFEWNYLERGPQVWKVAIAKDGGCGCSHQHFEKATEALKQDHQVIESVLAALQRLMQSPEATPLDVWRKAVDFISNFADRCHHLKEEKILFPALEERGMPSEGGPIGMMLFEHEQGRAYVKRMIEALELAKEDPEAATPILFEKAEAYSRLLQQHINKENEILFEMADGVLSPQEQKDLLRAFEEHEEKEMGSGVHQKYLKIAEELERYGT